MDCHRCHSGTIGPGTNTITLERGGAVILIRKVPATVCDVCGESTLGEAVAAALYRKGEEALARGAEVEISTYRA